MRSLKIPLINGKVKLNLQWTKHCVLSAFGNDNTDANLIPFIFKDTISAKDNQELLKTFSKEFERSVYLNKYKKIKRESKYDK